MSDVNSQIFVWTDRWLKAAGHPHLSLPITESTNDLAKVEAFESTPMMIYLADQQTQGRGRGGHTWSSPPSGSALMATWSLELLYPPQQLTAPIVGLHLFRAVHTVWPNLPWSLKAPNDLYLGGGKAGGLLVESLSRGSSHRLVIGLGLNVSNVPVGIPEATCLDEHLRSPITELNWQGFLQHLHRGFISASEQCGWTQLPEEVRSELLSALQKNPKTQGLSDLSPNGDLIFEDKIVNWYSL